MDEGDTVKGETFVCLRFVVCLLAANMGAPGLSGRAGGLAVRHVYSWVGECVCVCV